MDPNTQSAEVKQAVGGIPHTCVVLRVLGFRHAALHCRTLITELLFLVLELSSDLAGFPLSSQPQHFFFGESDKVSAEILVKFLKSWNVLLHVT